MGFFDRLRGREDKGEKPADEPAQPAGPLPTPPPPAKDPQRQRDRSPQKPRDQYYIFQHVALRQVLFEVKSNMAGALLSPKGDELLRSLWDDVAKSLRERGTEAPDPYPGIDVLPLKAGPFPCVVLRMPPPEKVTECHYVSIVLHFDPASEEPTEQTPVSYFTLEKGVSFQGEMMKAERTVLCEWTQTAHSNYGDGPRPDAQAFADAVGELLMRRGAR